MHSNEDQCSQKKLKYFFKKEFELWIRTHLDTSSQVLASPSTWCGGILESSLPEPQYSRLRDGQTCFWIILRVESGGGGETPGIHGPCSMVLPAAPRCSPATPRPASLPLGMSSGLDTLVHSHTLLYFSPRGLV